MVNFKIRFYRSSKIQQDEITEILFGQNEILIASTKEYHILTLEDPDIVFRKRLEYN